MCDKCPSKEHCDYIKKGDTYNCLKRTMRSANNREWNKHISEWNGWFQDL